MSDTTPTPERRTTAQLIEAIGLHSDSDIIQSEFWQRVLTWHDATPGASASKAAEALDALMVEIAGRLEEHDAMVGHLHRLFRLICELATTNGLGDAVEDTRALLARVDLEFARVTTKPEPLLRGPAAPPPPLSPEAVGRALALQVVDAGRAMIAFCEAEAPSLPFLATSLSTATASLATAVRMAAEIIDRTAPTTVDPGEWSRKYGVTHPLIHQIGDVELRSIDGNWQWRLRGVQGYGYWRRGWPHFRTRNDALAAAQEVLARIGNVGS